MTVNFNLRLVQFTPKFNFVKKKTIIKKGILVITRNLKKDFLSNPSFPSNFGRRGLRESRNDTLLA